MLILARFFAENGSNESSKLLLRGTTGAPIPNGSVAPQASFVTVVDDEVLLLKFQFVPNGSVAAASLEGIFEAKGSPNAVDVDEVLLAVSPNVPNADDIGAVNGSSFVPNAADTGAVNGSS